MAVVGRSRVGQGVDSKVIRHRQGRNLIPTGDTCQQVVYPLGIGVGAVPRSKDRIEGNKVGIVSGSAADQDRLASSGGTARAGNRIRTISTDQQGTTITIGNDRIIACITNRNCWSRAVICERVVV